MFSYNNNFKVKNNEFRFRDSRVTENDIYL